MAGLVEKPMIKTRILILSDTHGAVPWSDRSTTGKKDNEHNSGQGSEQDTDSEEDARVGSAQLQGGYRAPLREADVVIHCGDLTRHSNVKEFEDTFKMLREINAPLKLVIAGNHDLALDREFWDKRARQYASYFPDRTTLRAEYMGRADEVEEIVNQAKADGVQYLVEGTYEFVLQNGAKLRVYASPYTPAYGGWAFQYDYGHDFDIPEGVDVAMTHGPPKGVLDYTFGKENAGCHSLFESVYRARPLIHCFGHIHEAWGAQLVSWKSIDEGQRPTHYNAINHDKTTVVEKLHLLRVTAIDSPERKGMKEAKMAKMFKEKCATVDLSSESNLPLRTGEQTMFINAAVMSLGYKPTSFPWLVDIELPKAEEIERA